MTVDLRTARECPHVGLRVACSLMVCGSLSGGEWEALWSDLGPECIEIAVKGNRTVVIQWLQPAIAIGLATLVWCLCPVIGRLAIGRLLVELVRYFFEEF